ncbi:hypothetical protein ABPG77_004917 [Micractinium sp. CCAP 211/92]
MAAAGLGPHILARQDLTGLVIEAADNAGAAGGALACFTVQQPEERSFSDSVHALKGIPLSQLGDKLDLEDYRSNAHKCRYNPEGDDPWMRQLPNSPRSWPRNRSESLDVEGHTAQQGPGAWQPGSWQAAGTASGAAAATAGGGVQLLQRPAALRGLHDELAAPPGPMVHLASLHVQYGHQSGSCSVEGSSAVKLVTVVVPVPFSACALAAFVTNGVESVPEAPACSRQPAMPAASLPCSPAGVLPAAAPGLDVAGFGSGRIVAAHVAEASNLGPDCLPPQSSDGLHLPTTSMGRHTTAPRRKDPSVPLGPALAVALCDAAGHSAAESNAAAAGATADQQAVTTTTGTAGNGQQQHEQATAAAQDVKPPAPRSCKRKQPEAEAEAEVAVAAASQPAAPAAAAVAEGRTKRPSTCAGAARATKRQRTMAAAGMIEQAALASGGSTGAAATASAKKGRAALARKTAAPARPASEAISSAGRRRKGGRKQGRKTAKCIEERQEIYNRRESSRALSKVVGDNQSTVHRHKKQLQLKELLKTPAPPKSKEPFKRVISKGNRRDCRLLLSGEQLFHTGLLLGEKLRLSVRVGGRQLADLECKMQEATGQYQPQEAWIKALLDALEEPSPLRAPYTLVLQRREVQDGVAHVDASLEAQQQNQQQWWRGLQQRLQLPQ